MKLFNKIDWYIIRKYIGTYFFTLLIVILVVIIFDVSEKIDKFVDQEVPLNEIIFDYYGGFIPWILNSFGPLFVFIAAIFFTSQLASHSEIIAMLSSGVSFRRLLLPYMASATLLAVFYLVMGFYIIPPANQHRLDFENKYIKTQRTNLNSRNVHYQIAPGQFVYVEQFSSWSNTAYRFTLETIEENELKSKLSAESAAWDSVKCCWRLRNYYERDFYGESEVVRAGRSKDTVISLTVEDFYRRKNIVESLSEPELEKLIAVQRMRGDDMVKYALIEKHTRIATPFSAFILTLMAVSLSSRKRRGGIGLNIGLGLALSFSYILFQRFAQMFVHTGTLPTGLAIWLPNILYAFIAYFLYRMAPK